MIVDGDDWLSWSLISMIDDQSKSFLQMHCKDTTVELDVDPEDPEVLIMTCLVSIDHNIDDGGNDIENL